MEWVQVLTIIASTLGGVYVFFMITAERINRLEQFHREDIQKMDDKLQHMDEKWTDIIKNMDSKWERLFERLLVQDKKHG